MEQFSPRILIVDDDQNFVAALAEYARLYDCEVQMAYTVAGAREATERGTFDLVLVDLDLPDGNGLELISELDLASCGQIAIITGNPSARSAAKAFQLPILDYIEKPIDGAKLRQLLERASRSFAARPAPDQSELAGEMLGHMVGSSPIMQNIFRNIRLVAGFEVSVLICGESGTGKDLAARAIHEFSGRKGRLIPVNCGAVTAELLGSQLFGHEKGSFTGAMKQHQGYFEQAEGGTIFLDEITEMPLNLQVHLLRVLENRTITRIGGAGEQKVDVRVIAATNRDPKQAVADGLLREDLYYRLIDFPLTLPPLRERDDDLLLLAESFLGRLNTRYKTTKSFAPNTDARLRAHNWPGNIRELKHVVQRSYILGGETIELRLETPLNSAPFTGAALNGASMPVMPATSNGGAVIFNVGMTFEQVERQMLAATLRHFDNDKAKAAAALGVSVKTIYNRLARDEKST